MNFKIKFSFYPSIIGIVSVVAGLMLVLHPNLPRWALIAIGVAWILEGAINLIKVEDEDQEKTV